MEDRTISILPILPILQGYILWLILTENYANAQPVEICLERKVTKHIVVVGVKTKGIVQYVKDVENYFLIAKTGCAFVVDHVPF